MTVTELIAELQKKVEFGHGECPVTDLQGTDIEGVFYNPSENDVILINGAKPQKT